MKLFYDNSGKVVGTREGNFTHWFGDPRKFTNLTEVEADETLALELRDIKKPLHASQLKISNNKVVLPDLDKLPPSENIDL